MSTKSLSEISPGEIVYLHYSCGWTRTVVERVDTDLDTTPRLITSVGTVRWSEDHVWVLWRGKADQSLVTDALLYVTVGSTVGPKLI